MAKPNASQLVSKIQESKGNITALARAFHVSRTAVYQWIQSYPTAQQALKDEREGVVDVAESVLFAEVIARNMTAVAYVLNNSPEAKNRGWGGTVDSQGKPVQPITYIKEVRE